MPASFAPTPKEFPLAFRGGLQVLADALGLLILDTPSDGMIRLSASVVVPDWSAG